MTERATALRPAREGAAEEGSRLNPDGSVYIGDLVIPPSDLWSDEFRRFHSECVAANPEYAPVPIPARNAPKSQWDEFDAWSHERYSAPVLNYLRTRYSVDITETELAGVRVALISPRKEAAPRGKRRVLINLHGGGFVYNRGLGTGQRESIPVAALGGFDVVTLDYRQAPFHRYPAASEDVEAVYRELLKKHAPEEIGIYGCSAGGTLTAQALARFQAGGLPRPAAAGIFYIAPPPPCIPAPWQDGWGESKIWFSGLKPRSALTTDNLAFWEPVRWYMEGAALDDPQAYPGAFDDVLAKFPPTLFLSGTRDFAMSSVVAAHARALRLGVHASLYIIEGGTHAVHVSAANTPEAQDAQAYIAAWFRRQLAAS